MATKTATKKRTATKRTPASKTSPATGTKTVKTVAKKTPAQIATAKKNADAKRKANELAKKALANAAKGKTTVTTGKPKKDKVAKEKKTTTKAPKTFTAEDNQKNWKEVQARMVKLPKGFEPSPSDFKWRKANLKDGYGKNENIVWDGRPGIYICKDPSLTYRNYPEDYMTDPVTRRIIATYAPKKDRLCAKDIEGNQSGYMFRVDRRKFLKTEKGKKFAQAWIEKHGEQYPVLPIEYFEMVNRFYNNHDYDRLVAISFGKSARSQKDAMDYVGKGGVTKMQILDQEAE